MPASTRSVPSLALGLALIAAVTCAARPARAADYHFGFRLGLTEDVGTTVTDQSLVLIDPTTNRVTTESAPSRLQGVQFRTNLAGNVSLDILTSSLNHALVFGTGFAQTVPAAVPDDASGALRDRISTFQANAQYLGVIQRPRWGLALGAGWSFFSNGRLVAPSDGAAPSSTSSGQSSAPGQTLSNFVVTGQVHTLNTTAQLQLLRQSWDLTLGSTWVYTSNGVFNVAPGGPGLEGTPGGASRTQLGPQLPRITTNVGTFLRATTHALTPTATYRVRAGARGLVIANAISTVTLPVAGEDQRCVRSGNDVECVPLSQAGSITSTSAFTLTAPVPVPRSVTSLASLEYLHAFGPDRQLGLQASGTFGLRVPTDPTTLRPVTGASLDRDTAVLELSAVYSDLLPAELRLTAMAGLAQPWLFQPPLGATVPAGGFPTVTADLTPVFSVTLSRFFNPVNASLTALRRVSVGALGASAVVTNGASLDFRWQPRIFQRVAQLGLGFNANETRGLANDALFGATACDPTTSPTCALLQIATDNRGFGANINARYPFLAEGMFTGLFGATYSMSWLDPDPDNRLGRPAYTNHAALLTLSFSFGRGPLQELGQGGAEGAELSAFSANPATGSPLTSARLIRAGAPLLDGASGRRPGEPERPRGDDAQEAEVSRRRQAEAREAREHDDAVHGDGSAEEEEARALEQQAEERRARQERRTRALGEWPIDQLLPKAPAGDEPPEGDEPGPETKPEEETKPDAKAKPKKPQPEQKQKPPKGSKPDAKGKPDGGGAKDSRPDDEPEDGGARDR